VQSYPFIPLSDGNESNESNKGEMKVKVKVITRFVILTLTVPPYVSITV
jgi:hypothetical protein